MGEELAEEQLKDFCRRHGLAKDGYLDETELTTVCQCIGLQVSDEMIKELFEELDGDNDGRVCLSELSQMLRGMQDKLPPSPDKNKIKNDTTNNSPSRSVGIAANGFPNISVSERSAISILDPENTGFTNVGRILDLWSQFGIGESESIRLLSELGFPSHPKSHSVNLQDLSKSIEDEIDHSKERLPLVFQVALLTYRTEAQFIKSLCESIECERDKLKSDILDAHQRSALIAQEVDEQNARMERSSQMLMRKMEIKHSEQIQDIQDRFSVEKESLQQALHYAELKVGELQAEDSKLKSQINKLNDENNNLEKEVNNLSTEITNINRTKSHLEREVTRFIGLETQLQEMERKYVESLTCNDSKLKEAYAEMQALRDQNDELSMQLESVREKLRNIETSQTKEKRGSIHKKRKGHSNNCKCSKSVTNSQEIQSHCNGGNQCSGDTEDVPVNKMGKFYCRHTDDYRSIEDGEVCDSSLEQAVSAPTSISSCNSRNNLDHRMSSSAGSIPSPPNQPISIRLAACIGESSTDPALGDEEEMESEPSISAIEERLMMGQREKDCASLESEICAVAKAHEFDRSSSNAAICRNFLTNGPLPFGILSMSKPTMLDKGIQIGNSLQTASHIGIQTDFSVATETIKELNEQLSSVKNEMTSIRTSYEKENADLKSRCDELENSLQLMREEYEKTEDYWQDKLQEARELSEQDKIEADERLQDLLQKIKEYEDLVLSPTNNINDRLPPIEERASLERQVTDLEDECEVLRNELQSARMEQDSVITTYQRSFQTKLREECANLEQQVVALSKKCQDYERRLSSLAEEERSTVEESGMMDLLKERVKQLELQLRSQEDKFKQQIGVLEATLKERESLYKKSIPDIAKPISPQLGHNNWSNEYICNSKSKSLLEMLHNSQKPEPIWPQKFSTVTDKSSSLPFIPAIDPMTYAVQPSAWGSLSPSFQPDHTSSFGVPPTGGPIPTMKKAWCHVELGWLQSLRAKLKQRDEQCYLLQRALQQKDTQTEKLVTELKYRHEVEISNWEGLMQASQELLRQHVVKHKEQAEKLAHSDLLMKDLWVENAKLMAALNANEQRVIQLENLLKLQFTNSSSHTYHHHYSHSSGSSSPQYHHGNPHNNNTNNLSPQTNAIASAPLSLPHQSSHFNI